MQVYIGAFKDSGPLDQTDLKNGGDTILKAVENQHNNEAQKPLR